MRFRRFEHPRKARLTLEFYQPSACSNQGPALLWNVNARYGFSVRLTDFMQTNHYQATETQGGLKLPFNKEKISIRAVFNELAFYFRRTAN